MNQLLTDEEISEISIDCASVSPSDIYFARVIEAKILKILNSAEPVAWMQISVEEGVSTKFPRDHLPKKFNADWWRFEPLYEHPPAPSVVEWVSVEDRLPKKETPVLIFINESIRLAEIRWDFPGFEDTYKAYWYWDDPEDDGQEWERNDVTHWIHLPKQPVSVARSEE